MSRSAPVRVLVVHNRYRQRGGEDSVFDRETALLRNGAEVETWLVDNRGLVPLLGTALAGWRLPDSAPSYREARRRIAAARPDIVHVHNVFPRLTVSVFRACRDAGVPVVMTLHNFRIWCAPGTFFRAGRICEECVEHGFGRASDYRCYRGSRLATAAVVRAQKRHLQQRIWQTQVDRFLALTEFGRTRAIALGLPAGKVVVKPHFTPEPLHKRSAVGEYAVFVGRLSEEKGVSVALEAFRRMPARRLVIVGTGPLEERLRSEAPANVSFLGSQSPERVSREMAGASFLVFPSLWYEPFGMVLIEAMATGIPVACSRLGGLPEVVRDGKTGLLFEPGSAEGLAEISERLFREAEFNAALGRAGRGVYESDYSPAGNLERLLAIYRDAIAAGSDNAERRPTART